MERKTSPTGFTAMFRKLTAKVVWLLTFQVSVALAFTSTTHARDYTCNSSADYQATIRNCIEYLTFLNGKGRNRPDADQLRVSAYNVLAATLLVAGDNERVLHLTGKIREIYPSIPEHQRDDSILEDTYFLRSEAFRLMGRLEDANREVDRLIEINPWSIPVHIAKAAILMKQGRLREAETWMEYPLAVDPDDVRVQFSAGFLKEGLKEFRAARSHYQAALVQKRENPHILCGLARTACALQLLDRVSLEFRQCIQSGGWRPRQAQRQLRAAGYYSGEIYGELRTAAKHALKIWTNQGCPALPEVK